MLEVEKLEEAGWSRDSMLHGYEVEMTEEQVRLHTRRLAFRDRHGRLVNAVGLGALMAYHDSRFMHTLLRVQDLGEVKACGGYVSVRAGVYGAKQPHGRKKGALYVWVGCAGADGRVIKAFPTMYSLETVLNMPERPTSHPAFRYAKLGWRMALKQVPREWRRYLLKA